MRPFIPSALLLAALFAVACSSGGNPGGPDGGDGGTGPQDAGPTLKITTRFAKTAVNFPWLVVQAGDGGWSPATGTGGSYSVPMPVQRYGVTTICPLSDGGTSSLFTFYATLAEVPSLDISCASDDHRTFDVQVAGTAAAQGIAVSTNTTSGGIYPASAGTTSLMKLPFTGPSTFLLLELLDNFTVPSSVIAVDPLVLDGGTVSFDFSTDGTTPLLYTATFADAGMSGPAAKAVASMSYTRADGTVYLGGGPASAGTFRFLTLPQALAVPGALYTVGESVRYDAGTPTGTAQGFFNSYLSGSAANVTVDPSRVGTQLFVTASAVSTTPYPRVGVDWEPYPGAQYYVVIFSKGGNRGWVGEITAGWLGSATHYEMPDFTGIAGFDPNWAYQTASGTRFSVQALIINRPVDKAINQVAPEQGVSTSGAYVQDTLP